jgi:hypothetical protein
MSRMSRTTMSFWMTLRKPPKVTVPSLMVRVLEALSEVPWSGEETGDERLEMRDWR